MLQTSVAHSQAGGKGHQEAHMMASDRSPKISVEGLPPYFSFLTRKVLICPEADDLLHLLFEFQYTLPLFFLHSSYIFIVFLLT